MKTKGEIEKERKKEKAKERQKINWNEKGARFRYRRGSKKLIIECIGKCQYSWGIKAKVIENETKPDSRYGHLPKGNTYPYFEVGSFEPLEGYHGDSLYPIF